MTVMQWFLWFLTETTKYIKISNSALAGEMDNFYKRQKEGGYGVYNMKKIVEKYDGEINFSYENGLFHTDIAFSI